MTDQQIITHLQHNRYSLALEALYSVFPLVKKHIHQNSGSTDDAKDIFQDALVILYKKVNLHGFILSGDLSAFLFAIAKRCWYGELRQRKKLPIADAGDDFADSQPDDADQMAVAHAAFSRLGKKCRELLVAFYFKKQSFKTIALSLGFNDEKVAKNQKYRCLQKAKEYYISLSNNGTHE